MGRASRKRAAGRQNPNQAGCRYKIRPAEPGDSEAVRDLLQLVEFQDPGTAEILALVTANARALTALQHSAAILVAAGRDGRVLGVVWAGAPREWIGGLPAISNETRDQLTKSVVELWAVAVAEAVRGQGVGRALIDAAIAWSVHRGFRVMSGTVLAKDPELLQYYEVLGFTCGAAGEAFSVLEPAGTVLSRPAGEAIRFVWRPLHWSVSADSHPSPDGAPWRILTGVLRDPGGLGGMRATEGSVALTRPAERRSLVPTDTPPR